MKSAAGVVLIFDRLRIGGQASDSPFYQQRARIRIAFTVPSGYFFPLKCISLCGNQADSCPAVSLSAVLIQYG